MGPIDRLRSLRCARLIRRVKGHYGAHPLHLLTLLACFAFVGYVISVMGPKQLWNSRVWWQSILVWFLGAIVLNDLVLFPFYALADRSLHAGWRAVTGHLPDRKPRVPIINYLRIPALGSGLLFAMFFPGIIEQGIACLSPCHRVDSGPVPRPVVVDHRRAVRQQRRGLCRPVGTGRAAPASRGRSIHSPSRCRTPMNQ